MGKAREISKQLQHALDAATAISNVESSTDREKKAVRDAAMKAVEVMELESEVAELKKELARLKEQAQVLPLGPHWPPGHPLETKRRTLVLYLR